MGASSTLLQKDLDQTGEAQVNNSQVESHQKNGNQDYRSGSDGLFPRRPGYFLEFHPHLSEKLFGSLQKFSDPIHLFLFPEMKMIFLAGQEGFEPPSPGFGVRCSSR
jgi:hypothetical protein